MDARDPKALEKGIEECILTGQGGGMAERDAG